MSTQETNFVVGFDLDGVIIDHTQNKMRIAARYGVILTPEETHPELMRKLFSPDIYKEIQGQLYDSTGDALSSPLMEGAYDGLATLREHGIPYFLISRQKEPITALHLIERKGLWGEYFTPENTFFVGSGEEKDVVAKMLGITHYIDDEPQVLSAMLSVPNRILFDTRGLFADRKEFLHVKNWVEVARLLGVATS